MLLWTERKANKIVYKLDWNQTRKAVRVEIRLQPGEGVKDNITVICKVSARVCLPHLTVLRCAVGASVCDDENGAAADY